MRKRQLVLAVALSAIATFILTSVLYLTIGGMPFRSGVFGEYGLLYDIKWCLDRYYLEDVDDTVMIESAAKAMAQSVGDPYTRYYSPEEYSLYQQDIAGDYVGVGIVLTVNKNTNEIVVLSPYDNSPGAEAGVLPGDVVMAVDGEPVTADMFDKVAEKMRGAGLSKPEGTKVTITLRRGGGEPFDVELIRSHIEVVTVKAYMLEDGVGYIRISRFDSDTDAEVENALNDLEAQGMTKLVIDLRGNPGGKLDSCCRTVGKFLPEGSVITYTEDKNAQRRYYRAQGYRTDVPMVILINGASVSAAEVFTGAIRDNGRAEAVIGTRSFGKGIVQGMYKMRNGGGMTITISKYYSPNGMSIHGVGIKPDIVVEMPKSQTKLISQLTHDEDIQLQKAVEVLNSIK